MLTEHEFKLKMFVSVSWSYVKWFISIVKYIIPLVDLSVVNFWIIDLSYKMNLKKSRFLRHNLGFLFLSLNFLSLKLNIYVFEFFKAHLCSTFSLHAPFTTFFSLRFRRLFFSLNIYIILHLSTICVWLPNNAVFLSFIIIFPCYCHTSFINCFPVV